MLQQVAQICINYGWSMDELVLGRETGGKDALSWPEWQAVQLLRRLSQEDRQSVLDMARRLTKAGPAEEAVPAVRPLEARPRPLNLRAQLAVFSRCEQPDAGHRKAIPHYTGLAAGPGREVEASEDLLWVREHLPGSGIVSGRVATDSMLDTLLPGDIVLMQEYNGGKGVELKAIGKGDPKAPLNHIRLQVPDQSVCLLAFNGEAPFLKRVRYADARADQQDWDMFITADNQGVWEPRPVLREDSVRFYSRVLGLVR
jgi:hypothetical protein